MATIDDRYEMIEKAILAAANAKAAAFQKEEELFRKKALKVAKEDVLKELYNHTQEEIAELNLKSTRKVAQKESDQRHQLLLRREEITTSIFSQVQKRLKDYTETEQYQKDIIELAKDMASKYPLDNAMVMVRKEDYFMAAELNKIFSEKCRIMADGDIQIGGLRLMNQSVGIFVDESLDGKLEKQKPWFYAHSGLKIT